MKQLSLFGADKNSEKSVITLYIDGASRGNPGPSSVGCVIKRAGKIVQEYGYYLGNKTNNQAEYAALLIGLHGVLPHIEPDEQLLIISDSELLVKQLTGHYRVKEPHLKTLYAHAHRMLTGVDYRITHVLRAHNSHADMLANNALDAKIKLPEDLRLLIQDA